MFQSCFFFFFLLSGSLRVCVKKVNVKNAHKPILTTPMKVRIIFMFPAGAIVLSPIIMPITPVPRNIIIKTFSLFGSMYRILISGIKIGDYYKLTVNSNRIRQVNVFQILGNILNLQKFHLTLCQCSSAWLEQLICNQQVVGSDPVIGF